MERRKHVRIAVKFKVTLAFTGGGSEGDGKLLNLSEGGCAVESSKRVPQGAFLILHIYPPDSDTPVVIENAAVRWVRGADFGLEFMNLKPAEQAALRKLLQDLQAQAQGSA